MMTLLLLNRKEFKNFNCDKKPFSQCFYLKKTEKIHLFICVSQIQ